MKKIIIYVDTMNKPGGRERVVSNLIKKWKDEYALTLITKDDGKCFYELPRIPIISLGIPVEYTLRASRIHRIMNSAISLQKSVIKLRRVLKTLDYDYIYVATPQNAYEAYRAMENPQNKLVVSEHAYAFSFNKIYMAMKKFIYPRSYCISVPNKTDTSIYESWGCNAIYVPHAVTFTPNGRNGLRTKIAINVGRLTDDKQQSKLIEMWKHIKEKNKWELWIVGDGENQAKLRQQILDDHLTDTVKLIPSTQSIETIYRRASLFLLSSRWEGFGMVLLEAMGFGIPCISFDCPSGPRDVIVDSLNGYLVQNNNYQMFTDKIQGYINLSEAERDNMGNNAYKTVLNWDDANIYAKWREIFK